MKCIQFLGSEFMRERHNETGEDLKLTNSIHLIHL